MLDPPSPSHMSSQRDTPPDMQPQLDVEPQLDVQPQSDVEPRRDTPPPIRPTGRRRSRPTSTADFGSGRRESHDATAFYERFVPPDVTTDETVVPAGELDVIHVGDSRVMDRVATGSVALVVTSPPYFAGKQYEQELGVGGVPADYFDYLGMLRDVFAECRRVLEPGGRIAVNVANLGRRPYRSLSADVTQILSDLGLLLRGEIIWWKGRAAGGSCAWGSFQSPSNPTLRDMTERIIVASNGRFDRAVSQRDRAVAGLPSEATITREEFMEATTDLWELPAESARRIGHPAPFPVSLPQRLIELYTYAGDVILDPFMGSGSTAVAAVRTHRHFIGYDTDATYAHLAEERVATELSAATSDSGAIAGDTTADPADATVGPAADEVVGMIAQGRQAKDVAEAVVAAAGFVDIRRDVKPKGLGINLDIVATDQLGGTWAFEVAGAFTASSSGLRRSDALLSSIAVASVLHNGGVDAPSYGPQRSRMVLLTTQAPVRGSAGFRSLQAVTGPNKPVHAVIEMLDGDGRARLAELCRSGA